MDTAQPTEAAETDGFASVVASLTTQLNEQARDDRGRFAPNDPEPQDAVEVEQTDAVTEGEEPDDAVDDDAGEDVESEAAEEAQPDDDIPLPASWSKEDEGTWSALPASAKAKIFAREAQREAAVNSKFQEAANERKAAEALRTQAAAIREHHAQAIDQMMAVIQPQRPSRELLNINSEAYNPDAYHAAMADFEAASEYLGSLQAQRQQLAAQREAEELEAFSRVETEFRPKLFGEVPALADPATRPAAFAELRDYGVSTGIPEDVLHKATSAELLVLSKAMRFDRQQAAAKAVKPKPKPAAPLAPPMRPGVTQGPSTGARQAHAKAQERLQQTGSVSDAAAVIRQFLR